MATAGSIYVDIKARTENFESGMRRSSSALGGFASRVKMLGPAIVAGISGVAVVKAMNWYVSKMQEIGKATESLTSSQIKRVNEFNSAVTRLRSNVSNARNGLLIDITPTATSAVKMLNDTFVMATGKGRISNAAGSEGGGVFQTASNMSLKALQVATGNIRPIDHTRPLAPGLAAEQMAQSKAGFPFRLGKSLGGSLLGGGATTAGNSLRNLSGLGAAGLSGLGAVPGLFQQARGAALMAPFAARGGGGGGGGGRNWDSIAQLEAALGSLPDAAGGSGRRGANVALRQGSGGAQQAVAANRMKEREQEVQEKQLERLEEIREAIREANEAPSATTLPVFSIGGIA